MMKFGLNRILKQHGHPDITKSPIYKDSQQAYEKAAKELKSLGYGDTDSAPEITEEGEFLFFFSLNQNQTNLQ